MAVQPKWKECTRNVFHPPSVLFNHCPSKPVYMEMMGWMDWQANRLFFPPSFPSQDPPPQLGWINGWHCSSACNLAKMLSFPLQSCFTCSRRVLHLGPPLSPHQRTFHSFWRGHAQAAGSSLSWTCAFDLLVHTVNAYMTYTWGEFYLFINRVN